MKAAPLYPNGPAPILNERLAFQGRLATNDPGRIRYHTPSMRMLLRRAYQLRPEQIVGPAWIDEQGYEIMATFAPGTGEQQIRVMLQSLLAERFEMQVHREKKTMSIYALVVAKDGSKLEIAKPLAQLPEDPGERAAALEARRNETATRIQRLPRDHPGRNVHLPDATVEEFITNIAQDVDRPIFDRTELKGKFGFDLWWATIQPGYNSEIPVGESIFDTIKTKLGLELQPRKEEIEVLVIDKANRTPIGN